MEHSPPPIVEIEQQIHLTIDPRKRPQFFFPPTPGLQSTPLIARFHPYKYASTRNSTIQTIFKLGGADT